MAHPRHEEVRRRYHRCCGYCGVSETETGGELTVDHYQPVSAGGDDRDDNLIYACFRCNTYKGDFYPSPDDSRAGNRILHPLLDSVASHVGENPQTGLLEPLTPSGRFHILLLRLNRPQLVEPRLARRLRELLLEAYQWLRHDEEVLRLRVVLLETYLRELKRRQAEETEPDQREPPG
jgi:hypothetical protein